MQKLETKLDFLLQQQRKVLQKINPDVLEDLPEEPEETRTPSRRSRIFDSSYWSIDSASSADEQFAGSEGIENESDGTKEDISRNLEK